MPSLGNDLAAFRKELDMSIEDVHKTTKIPTSILKSIEDDTIFSDLNRNTTYVRSYVRSYAKALKIDDDLVVRALDQVKEESYTGLLQQASGGEVKPKFQYDSPETGEDHEAPSGEEKPEDDMVHDHAPTGRQPAPPRSSESQPDHAKGVPAPPSVNSIDWADMGKRFYPLQKRSRIWVGVLILVIAAIGIAGFIYFTNQYNGTKLSQGNIAPEKTTPVQADSLQLNLTSPEGNRTEAEETVATQQPAEALPDTLEMVIYAAYGKLEPVRVYSDVIGSLNPYWIEQGNAVPFEFVNTLRIRGQYSRMVLMMNGHVVEDFRQQFMDPESGMIEITRDVFEGEEKWLQPPPDSLGLNVAPPKQILERPTFN